MSERRRRGSVRRTVMARGPPKGARRGERIYAPAATSPGSRGQTNSTGPLSLWLMTDVRPENGRVVRQVQVLEWQIPPALQSMLARPDCTGVNPLFTCR